MTTAPGSGSRRAEDAEAQEIPSEVVVVHRLGNLTVRLGERKCPTREEAEATLLYKELKHNYVNQLDRLLISLVCFIISAFCCHVFSALASEWLVVSNGKTHRAIGLFVTCREAVSRFCLAHSDSMFVRAIYDKKTSALVCEVTESYVRVYIILLWCLGVTQLVCICAALFLSLRVACRPTRSRCSVAVMYLLAALIPITIATTVLFTFYTKCDQRTCEALHLEPPQCIVYKGWGYNITIAAVLLDILGCLTSVYMCSYPSSLRLRAHDLLQQQNKASHDAKADASTATGTSKSNWFTRISQSIRSDQDGLSYLTAGELGVCIKGADDWVYDHRSDMFYSFALEMFWDPITRHYYSTTLRSWHVTPDGYAGLNDIHSPSAASRRILNDGTCGSVNNSPQR
uniref:Uncharacterized protein n=1 Tax=Trypanosoma vivax (strain Y486) TaxID=1055687 RepID=G0TS01_TRYVY|nr:conserved hypothetical protein [Trypanosoma vivax Y486]